MFTFKNGEFMTNKIIGVGGEDGMSSGVVSSPVSAKKIVNRGYAGVGVFTAYKSVILIENK